MSAFGGKADMRCPNVQTIVASILGAASRFVHRAVAQARQARKSLR